jgi:hypothetical protein
VPAAGVAVQPFPVSAPPAGNVGSVRIANAAVDYGPSATGEVVPGLPGGLPAQGYFRFFG